MKKDQTIFRSTGVKSFSISRDDKDLKYIILVCPLHIYVFDYFFCGGFAYGTVVCLGRVWISLA